MDGTGAFIGSEADAADGTIWQRATVRQSMLLMSTLRLADGTTTMIRVRNLSAGGLMGECDRRPATGERIEVELRNIGPVTGAVAWAGGGKIGIRFDGEIDPGATRKAVGTGIGTSKIIVAQTGSRPGFR